MDRATPKSKTSVEVEIFGVVYPVRGEHDPQHLERLARLVDRKMREIRTEVSTVDTGKIAILAALNLADELIRCNEQQEGERVQIQEKVAELTGELTQALDSKTSKSSETSNDGSTSEASGGDEA